MSSLVIQFAKFPCEGKVKTRLAPLLGNDGCYQIHQNLVRHTALQIQQTPFYRVLAFDAIAAHELLDELAVKTPLLLQQGADLGERVLNAFKWGLKQAHSVILVGSDCPVLTPEHYRAVNSALDEYDHVFIPAEDGGYVLIASRTLEPRLFDGISWGTGEVWSQTQQRLAGKSYVALPELWDVDRPEDFNRLIRTIPSLCVL